MTAAENQKATAKSTISHQAQSAAGWKTDPPDCCQLPPSRRLPGTLCIHRVTFSNCAGQVSVRHQKKPSSACKRERRCSLFLPALLVMVLVNPKAETCSLILVKAVHLTEGDTPVEI